MRTAAAQPDTIDRTTKPQGRFADFICCHHSISSAVRTCLSPPWYAAHTCIASPVGKNIPELTFTLGGKILTLLAALSPRLTDRLMTLYHDRLAEDLEEQQREGM